MCVSVCERKKEKEREREREVSVFIFAENCLLRLVEIPGNNESSVSRVEDLWNSGDRPWTRFFRKKIETDFGSGFFRNPEDPKPKKKKKI